MAGEGDIIMAENKPIRIAYQIRKIGVADTELDGNSLIDVVLTGDKLFFMKTARSNQVPKNYIFFTQISIGLVF